MQPFSPFTAIGIAACALNLTLIAALPTVLFKPGRKHALWWLTAAPLVLAGIGLLLGLLQVGVWSLPSIVSVGGTLGAVGLSGASIALISWAGRSHRRPLSLWQQEDDRPPELVTWGPYRWIRHPLYSAFLLTLAAAVLAAPGLTTITALIGGVVQLSRTAAREERRISDSPLGESYQRYMSLTGRFVPRGRPGA